MYEYKLCLRRPGVDGQKFQFDGKRILRNPNVTYADSKLRSNPKHVAKYTGNANDVLAGHSRWSPQPELPKFFRRYR